MKKILVMSAGQGGQALAGELALRGHRVTLYEHPAFASVVEAIRAKNLVLELTGKISGKAKLTEATTDAATAMRGAELIFFAAPSYAQKAFFDLTLPYFEDGQVIVLTPGNFGTFSLKAALDKAGKKVLVGELDNLPYVCATPEPGRVEVRGVKKLLTLASLPMTDYATVDVAMQGSLGTAWSRGKNVLHTSIAAMNMVLHCLPMLMNCGRIESDSDGFKFYFDGMTPSVCAAAEALDKERLAVAAAFGLTLPGTREMLQAQYGVSGADMYAVIQANAAYAGISAPRDMRHRFLTEDVPFGLVPTAALGEAAGVPTPVMDAAIILSNLALGEDQRSIGQNLGAMGLRGRSVEGIVSLL